VPKGTVSDVDEGARAVGSDVVDMSALFMNAGTVAESERPITPFEVDEPPASGVLDIRALADAYEFELDRRRGEEGDQPPMVDATSLGLLMPQPAPAAATPRVNYLVWGMAALLLVAGTAAATAFAVKQTMTPVAVAAPTAEQCAQLARTPAAAPAVVAAPAAAPVVVAAAPAAAPVVVSAPPAAVVTAVAVPDSGDRASANDEDDEARRARHERRRLRKEREAAEAAEREAEQTPAVVEAPEVAVVSEPVVEPAEPAPAAKPVEPKAASSDTCDEVACLVDPSSACCAKAGSAKAEKKAEPKQNLPERLTASEVNSGLRPRRGRIESCGDRHGFQGTAKIKLTITPAGKVGSATVGAGNSAFKSCVVSQVKKTSFKQTQKGMTLSYPIVFR